MSCNFCCKSCMGRLHTRQVPIFESLSEEELNRIINIIKHIEVKKGESLFLEGNKVSKLFIINDGIVKLTKSTINGKEQIVNILTVGDFLGESNILGETLPSNVSAIAVRSTKICTISREDLKEILHSNPTIALKLLSEMNKRLIEVENLTSNLSNNNPEARIVCMLLEFAEKYGKNIDEKVEIDLPLNREEMANYCGIARETLSRKLTLLENDDTIETIGTKKIIINDLEVLEEVLA